MDKIVHVVVVAFPMLQPMRLFWMLVHLVEDSTQFFVVVARSTVVADRPCEVRRVLDNKKKVVEEVGPKNNTAVDQHLLDRDTHIHMRETAAVAAAVAAAVGELGVVVGGDSIEVFGADLALLVATVPVVVAVALVVEHY